MEKSQVYFTDFRVTGDTNLLHKLKRLIKKAGIERLGFENKFVAIKLHFGEPGNLAYLRPNWTKVVADLIYKNNGRPFLTDCNTLYVGRRKNALDHIGAAYENGYNPFTTGCQIIIGDGLKGTDEELVAIDGEYVKSAKIGRGVMDADIVISMNHFKCHEATGIGGAIKNIGMGCGSRAGKMEMHSAGKPFVAQDLCIACKRCAKNCAHEAIAFQGDKAKISHERCVGCGRCIGVCPTDAVQAAQDEANDILDKKMAEYAYAVLRDRPHFHISILADVSPYCDCHAENDLPIIPDVGIFASFDPVALDTACTDMGNAQPVLEGSALSKKPQTGDHFKDMHPDTDWRITLEHAQKMGLGQMDYELIRV